MSTNNKVIWTEGMLLRHQHFQQQEKYNQSITRQFNDLTQPYNWGIKSIKFDKNALALGKIIVTECSGIMPDGTPFDIPEQADTPLPLEIKQDCYNCLVYLALPLQKNRQYEVELKDKAPQHLNRYCPSAIVVKDNTSAEMEEATIYVARLYLRILLETDDRSQFSCIPIAQIKEGKPGKKILFEDNFIAPLLCCHGTPLLQEFINEVYALLSNRADMLVERLSTFTGRGGTMEIIDFVFLQIINRYIAIINHLAVDEGILHPLILYRYFLQIVGEFTTLTNEVKKLTEWPTYQHDNLSATFLPLIAQIRRSLNYIRDQTAISLLIEENKTYGTYLIHIDDNKLLEQADFILAVKADMELSELEQNFITHSKLGSIDNIETLIKTQVSGIGLHSLVMTPPEIPFHAGYCYFAVDTKSNYWLDVVASKGIALHIIGDFPGLKLEFWAIRRWV